ncbi:HypC/HybG/HupF family hydrogenase formation chaperone [Nitrosococcus wardiae]|uniref:HypC/HybG/HupF family hydrogenase formation chaperone n=1 Tax=Nitrosococcus wardiae TaxID=1814290 RepID=A0A4P7C310_9GAMM|nr:HypC/HybG/HupF family hydrogenase formation chaperone [Nitrosococcus wardiae]QBQ55934.1 HypC/HybG/HupF family hydrogenase formation chaperone [Nitrosococcus wardiae]
MCLGIPAQIVNITDAENLLAVVSVGGVKREISLACVVEGDSPLEAWVGEWVLVHVGFAMSRIDPEEAEKTLKLLEELGELQAQMEGQQGLTPRDEQHG